MVEETGRCILHCDMNNCYASIERMMHPELKGKAMVVGGNEEHRHGIVLAKSPEAKAKGIRTGEVLWEARAKCPELIVVPPHFSAYEEVSHRARALYTEYSPRVESFGIDECWVDITRAAHLFGGKRQVAEAIRRRMREEIGISVSIGMSFTKEFAKLGSDLAPDDAIYVVDGAMVPREIWPRSIRELLGVGPKTEQKLHCLGIRTIGALAAADPELLRRKLGAPGLRLFLAANGQEVSPVAFADTPHPIQTIGNGITMPQDIHTMREMRQIVFRLAEEVVFRLRRHHRLAGGVEISLRDSDFVTKTYHKTLPRASKSEVVLARQALAVVALRDLLDRPIRSVALRAFSLRPDLGYTQIDCLWDDAKERRRMDAEEAMYALNLRYGKRTVHTGVTLDCTLYPEETSDVLVLPGGHASPPLASMLQQKKQKVSQNLTNAHTLRTMYG